MVIYNKVIALSASSGLFQVIFIIVIFVFMLFAAYYTTRFVGNVNRKHGMNANMLIIEAIPVGPQKTLQLVRVGKEYYLIGVTKEQITFLSKVEEDSIELAKKIEPQDGSFKKIFEDFRSKKNK